MAFVTRRAPLTWGCMITNAQTLNIHHSHSIHTLSGGGACITQFNNNDRDNINSNTNDNSLFYLQLRTARYRPKRLLVPTIKRKYKKPHTMKYSEFSDDTLHSISHGEDSYTKVKRSDFMKKLSYWWYTYIWNYPCTIRGKCDWSAFVLIVLIVSIGL